MPRLEKLTRTTTTLPVDVQFPRRFVTPIRAPALMGKSCARLPLRLPTDKEINMSRLTKKHILTAGTAVVTVWVFSTSAMPAAAQQATQEKKILSFPAEYVRRVETDQAVLVLGYRTANLSVGKEWMLLDVAMSVFPGHNMTLTRDAFTLTTPDEEILPLASQQEFNQASGTLRALDARPTSPADSLDYLPKRATDRQRMGFFSDPSTPGRSLTHDRFSMNPDTACIGRLYFKIPGGIQYGRYFLDVELANGKIDAPILIMTEDQLKEIKSKVKAWEKEQKRLAKEAK
jgi:hypothetical protein